VRTPTGPPKVGSLSGEYIYIYIHTESYIDKCRYIGRDTHIRTHTYNVQFYIITNYVYYIEGEAERCMFVHAHTHWHHSEMTVALILSWHTRGL
jgi:predicted HAD superfamily hydrolase